VLGAVGGSEYCRTFATACSASRCLVSVVAFRLQPAPGRLRSGQDRYRGIPRARTNSHRCRRDVSTRRACQSNQMPIRCTLWVVSAAS
jgi:hypothetical protein